MHRAGRNWVLGASYAPAASTVEGEQPLKLSSHSFVDVVPRVILDPLLPGEVYKLMK
jgi:hypothetical protein